MAVVRKPEEYSWVRYIKRRIKMNKNFLAFISGPTGSGKSYCSLSLGELLDLNFDISRVAFSPKALMQIINEGDLKSGDVIVFEECGVNMSSRNWQSTTNKMLNFLMQTFRHRNFILIMNAPYMDFCDAQTRRLFHAEFRTQTIDLDKQLCKVKPYCIQYNGRLQKFYYKYLRVSTRGKRGTVPVIEWNIPKPSAELIKSYEVKKREFTDALNKDIVAEIDQATGKTKRKLSMRQEQVLELVKQGMNVKAMSDELNIAERTVRQVMLVVRQKGYKIEPIYTEDNRVEGYKVL